MIAAPSNQRRTRLFERIVFWSFRLGTYFVLLCATYIFLDIGIKGGRTVFQKTAPFVNVKFLTEPPQTLYVFDYQGKKMELSDREFRDWVVPARRRHERQNPGRRIPVARGLVRRAADPRMAVRAALRVEAARRVP